MNLIPAKYRGPVIVGVVLLIGLILWASRKRIAATFAPDLGDTDAINDRELEIEDLARDLMAAIYSFNTWNERETYMGEALQLTDQELRYLNTFYNQIADNDLLEDVEGEWMASDVNERLAARLRELGN